MLSTNWESSSITILDAGYLVGTRTQGFLKREKGSFPCVPSMFLSSFGILGCYQLDSSGIHALAQMVWSWQFSSNGNGKQWITKGRYVNKTSSYALASPLDTPGLFAQWTQWNHLGLALWHGGWPQNSCTTVLGAMLPGACFMWWTSFRSSRPSSTLWASKWRQHHCYCTAAKDSCNLECVCFVVWWRK